MCTGQSFVVEYLFLTILIQNFTIVHLVLIEHSLAEVNVPCALYQGLCTSGFPL